MDWEEWRNKIFYKHLLWQVRPARIKRFLRQEVFFNKHQDDMESQSAFHQVLKRKTERKKDKIKVAALQVEMKLYGNPLDFVAKMNSLIRQAARKGAQLVVLPEDNLTQLIGLLPGIGDIELYSKSDDFDRKGNEPAELFNEMDSEDIKITDILRYIGQVIKQCTMTTFSRLAQIYGIYIMTGTGMLPAEDGNIYNIGYLFGPDGSLLGEQKKTHLFPIEGEWGIDAGDELKVIPTEIGQLAFPICMDATYFETFRIVSQKGAEIVMIPIANPNPEFNYWTALRGIWPRVQESIVYGIKSAMVGNFMGFILTGQAGIYAPLELTPARNGILAEAESFDREEIVVAELDLALLQQLKNDHPLLGDVNRELWERYFPEVYYLI